MYLKNILYGIIIGIGFIVPGVSGGVIATILGIYNTLIFRINHFFNNIKDNFLYILPLILGIIIGVFSFSNIILFLLNNHYEFISYIFIGLILGCVPYLRRELKTKEKKGINIIPFFISFIFGLYLYIIYKYKINTTNNTDTFSMIIAGLIYAIGKIIPGISGSALLILIGLYNYLLNIISNPLKINLTIIISFIPFIISFIISAIILLRIMEYLLNNHYRTTYSAIIGFIISSILFIYPNTFSFIDIVIVISAFSISYYLS